jgi:hypothetical protein
MLVALNGFILAFIGGLLAFVGSSAFSNLQCNNVSFVSLIPSGCLNPWPVLIAINIAIFVLFLWRKYSHYIDDDIMETYCKILYCEKELPIDFNATLLKSIALKYKPLPDILVKSNLTKDDILREYNFLFEKFEKGDIPERGHKIFDRYTSFFIVCLTFVEIILVIFMNQCDFFIGVILSIAIFGGWGLALLTYLMINQKKSIKNCKQFG